MLKRRVFPARAVGKGNRGVAGGVRFRFDPAMWFTRASTRAGLPTLVATLAVALPAAASATVPEFVNFEFPAGAEQVAVRPARIGFYDVCEPGFAGTRSALSKLTWHRWTSSKAVGDGALWTVSKCGTSVVLHRYPVRLTLYDAKRLAYKPSRPATSQSRPSSPSPRFAPDSLGRCPVDGNGRTHTT